jgi:hypothetical protein
VERFGQVLPSEPTAPTEQLAQFFDFSSPLTPFLLLAEEGGHDLYKKDLQNRHSGKIIAYAISGLSVGASLSRKRRLMDCP